MIQQAVFDDLVQKKSNEIKDEKDKMLANFVKSIEAQTVPTIGGTMKGKVVEMAKNSVRVDLGPFGLGVVRGEELWASMDVYPDVKVGDIVEVTVLEFENEDGNLELSFKKLTKGQAWQELEEKRQKGEIITVKIQSANKGGLLTSVFGIPAFMPVSQLIPEHYPRVEGGDSSRILSKLQEFAGKKMRVKVITADPREDKLIISEKAAILDQQKKRLTLLKVGDIITGAISGVVDFGAFIKFNSPRQVDEEFEGLIHISELAWQKIKDPADIVKVGDKVKAQIISVDTSKITLSMKKLLKDPWQDNIKGYKVGQKVKGRVVKLEPYGAIIQLDKVVNGLVHISELAHERIKNIDEVLKINREYEFKIVSIEPEEHRVGLSLRALIPKPEKEEVAAKKEVTKKEEKPVKKETTKKEEKPKKKEKKVKK